LVEDRIRVDKEKLTEFSATALEKLGLSHEDALITARMLVSCDLRGVESHRVAHLRMFYARRIQRGLINLNAKPQIISRLSSTAIMDGDNGFGFVIGYHAMNEAIRRASNTGAGFIAVRNSTHFGAAAYYAMMALQHDMIGFAMTNAIPTVVAPGSAVPALGTNPLAVAVPAGKQPPFVLDMATSAVAGGKIEIAVRSGSMTIPEGWIIDGKGKTITDLTKRIRGEGGLVPLGGDPVTGSFKGFGLGLLVDILCGVLSGSTAGILRYEAPEARGNAGDHFFGALRIDSFLPVTDFKKTMDEMINALEALPTVPGIDKVTIPGIYEASVVEDRQASGIPLHPQVVSDLKTLAEELNMDYDLE
jgi:LDH2 family malate/lactate/ureidoglycolate dehydrogenase